MPKWITESALRDPEFKRLSENWSAASKQANKHFNIVGPVETHAGFILSALNLIEQESFSFVVVPDELQARRVQAIIQAFYPGEVLSFPAREFNLTQVESTSKDAMHERLRVMSKIINADESEHKPIVVLSTAPLQQRIPNLSNLADNFIEIKLGQEYNPSQLLKDLTYMGYRGGLVADSVGEFSQRGDIIDIVPIDRKQATTVPEEERQRFYGVRISFFDTEIDQIRLYDVETQRQIEPVNNVFIPPASEVLINDTEAKALAEKILDYAESHSKTMYQQGAERDQVEAFRAIAKQDSERIANGMYAETLDKWLDLLYDEKYSLLNLFADLGGRAFVFDVKRVQESLDAWQANKTQQIEHLLLQNKTVPLVSENIIGRARIMQELDADFSVSSFSLLDHAGNGFPGAEKYRFRSLDVENYRSKPEEFYEMAKTRQAVGASTYVYVADQAKRDQLNTNLLLNAPSAVNRLVPRSLNQGFEWPEAGLLIIGNENIFGQRYKTSKRKKKDKNRIQFFSDLELADYVVHEDHGIGIYEGLEAITTESGTRDYIKIAYAKGDNLFLPMEAIEQLSKYIAMDSRKPKISRLGGGEWNKLKTRARDSIRKLATNLVKLYAQRNKVKGHKFLPATTWEKEFADDFEFEETDDQLQALDEINSDMETDKVMDRLLVGDVGFGKTELAFRAMFKAVNNSMQAAMIAPTTVLAQQHYEKLLDRTKNYPVKVGLLSRFVSPAQQKETLRGLANGEIDVVIGTHRILSKDVEFKRLGVLVIDEEQRFGVDHKETLKEKYPQVDVLSLTATPIPRTLHMSLSGIRDISTLEEAPQERREVQTFVMEYDHGIIMEALSREIGRGGQVFYLINNVSKIGEAAMRIEKDLPGIRAGIAHGQMPEGQLEQVIQEFLNGEYDVLVCTTIIESGIDMPNVNTLVVTGAERFGLAQMYQIRGRVGRSNRQAYAYITYERDRSLNEDAQKRLATIRDYTALGSGMKVAMRDLEVRGAGNLLGGEQHGHMEAIGYDLYVQMLEEEVSKVMAEEQIEGLEIEEVVEPEVDESKVKLIETQIDIQLDAYLPQSLIPAEGQRMDMYRRLIEIDSKEDYHDIIDELEDRYGDIPSETYTLADISYVQNRASVFGISKILIDKQNIVLDFDAETRPNMHMLAALLNIDKYKREIKFNAIGSGRIVWAGSAKIKSQVPRRLRELFMEVDTAMYLPVGADFKQNLS